MRINVTNTQAEVIKLKKKKKKTLPTCQEAIKGQVQLKIQQ